MSFEKSDSIIMNDHKYKYIREIRNIITEETAVLCEDECGSFCFCSKAEWAELIEKEKQAKIVQYEGSGQNKMIDPEAHTFNKYVSPQEKIELFKSLFIGRRDVFARRFYNTKTGKSGYVPVCHNEWQYGVCDKKKYKCSQCPNSAFAHISDRDVFRHLKGDDEFCRDVIGVYPLMPGDMTIFLAIDFDDEHWQEDVRIVRDTCKKYGIPCSIERSRSGNGAHLWLFFAETVSARDARILGSSILTRSMELRHELKFDSYDRMFPNQDIMPKGGFGNLIALPLQGRARKSDNSSFVDDNFNVIDDQWQYLFEVKRIAPEQLQSFISELGGASELGDLVTEDEKPWQIQMQPDVSASDFPERVTITKANMLYVRKEGVSEKALNKMKRLAAFRNPDFYKTQAMRLPVYNKPRIIDCSDETEQYICLPRGCEDELVGILEAAGVEYEICDERSFGNEIRVSFNGSLRPQQQDAANAMLMNDIGVLSATTAFGKTVTAAYIIAQRKVSTLILVHSSALLEQWEKSLSGFLTFEDALPEEPKKRGRKKKLSHIGKLGAGKNTLNGIVDIAIMQSVVSGDDVKEFVRDYRMVIVDECHHVSAFSFEKILRFVSAEYVYGLTATAIRQDGHQPIIFMQCGPIRYKADALTQAINSDIPRKVVPRFTEFRTAESGLDYTELCSRLSADKERNDHILSDILSEYGKGRNILILTERTEHADFIFKQLSEKCRNLFLLIGQDKAKEKRMKLEALKAVPQDESIVIVAIGKYVGEGFDEPRLDTLFLAMPISWKGRLSQYAGRLHRIFEGKKEIKIFDYVDLFVPMLERMYHKRLRGYSGLGYYFSGSENEDADLIYDTKNYVKKYDSDIVAAVKSITICSPRIKERQFWRIYSLVPDEVSLNLICSSEEKVSFEFPEKVSLIRTDMAYYRFTVIDDRVVWYGSLSPLCENFSEASAIRIINPSLAGRLMEERLL